MSQSKVIDAWKATDVSELLNAVRQASSSIDSHDSTVYILNHQGNPVTLALIENILTDGSKVYYLRLS